MYTEYANVPVQSNWLLNVIVVAAGGESCSGLHVDGKLYVPGVTQAALDAALAGYDDAAEKSKVQWAIVRSQRSALLAASDYTQIADVTCDKAAWATYRQALRDITLQPDPFAINWPVKPSA